MKQFNHSGMMGAIIPCSKMSHVELAYFAGLIDGEGSISLARSHANRTRGRYIYPLLRIANTDKRMIDWISSKIDCGSRSYKSAMNERCKPVHHLCWCSKDAISILRFIYQYLIVKKEQAKIALDMWDSGIQARRDAGGYLGNGHPIPTWLMDQRERAFSRMQELNTRGIKCR